MVEIKEFEEGKLGLFASRQIDSGYIILVLDGNYFPEPTRTSIQIGDRHMEHYEGGFMNHHCDPSAKIVRLHAHGIIEPLVLASRKINQGEQVTFDYETTEEKLNNPFKCDCHNRWIRGNKLSWLGEGRFGRGSWNE